jgi:hypothetical protein
MTLGAQRFLIGAALVELRTSAADVSQTVEDDREHHCEHFARLGAETVFIRASFRPVTRRADA